MFDSRTGYALLCDPASFVTASERLPHFNIRIDSAQLAGDRIRQDADGGVRQLIDGNRLAENRRIARVVALPEGFSDERDVVAANRALIGCEQAPDDQEANISER